MTRGLPPLPQQDGAETDPLGRRLEAELELIAVVFERQLASELSAVNGLCRHIEQYRGKMLRPALVILSGLAAAGDRGDGETITEAHRTVAAVTEMIHMATLVHDDVLDEAHVRRGGATVNRLRGNEVAVMLGDYLISNAFHLCSTAGDPTINLLLGEVTNTLCEGELVQLHHRDDLSLDEATYFEIVRRKTASLIGACCRLGALLSGAGREVADALHRYGEALGIAFQIRDDLLDLVGDERVVGKTLGRDLEKGKLTLPLIHWLTGCDQAERGEAIRLIERQDAAAVRERLVETGALEHTTVTARRLAGEAVEELVILPPTPARELLHTAAESVISRTY
ncbi:MAG: polyprenyl synthetase family protein [Planctomycetota bacterium]|jgi:octaprenyl-diphosphate synthase